MFRLIGGIAVRGLVPIALLILVFPSPASAQLRVIVSGGFAATYRQLLPEFERTTGATVSTASGASQGAGPDTIAAQLRRGDGADVVILSREGLNDLVAEHRIMSGTAVDLASTLIGMAVRSGAPRPQIGTVDLFKAALVGSKVVAVSGSTTGIYLTGSVFPRLGLTDVITVKIAARGSGSTAMVAGGEAAAAVQPVSELLHVAGIDYIGTIPESLQYVSVFSAAIVSRSKQIDLSKKLIAFLASARAVEAMTFNGMQPVKH